MSVFDKFNVNPYISTYAGAPVAEFQQTANTLQNRYYANLDYADKLSAGLAKLQSTGEDKEFLEEIKKEYRDKIAAASEAPELATRQVRNLGREFANNEDIAHMAATKAKLDAANKAIADGELSSYQSQKVFDALAEYKRNGGARKGQVLNLPTLYEEVDINKMIDEQVKGIKGFETGISHIKTEPDGTKIVVSNVGKEVPLDKIKGTAVGVFNNPKVQRQLNDELNFRNRGMQEGDEGFMSIQDLQENYMNPAMSKYYEYKDVENIKGGPKGGSGSGTGKNAVMGQLYATTAPAKLEQYGYGEDPEANIQTATRETAAAQERMANWNANGDSEGYTAVDYARDDRYVALQQKSFKDALLAEDVLGKHPGLQGIIQNASEAELYDLRTRTVNKDGAVGQIQTFIDEGLEDIDTLGGMTSVLNQVYQEHGEEVASILYSELTGGSGKTYNPNNTIVAGYKGLHGVVRENHPGLQSGTEEYEVAFANTVANALENAQDQVAAMNGNIVGDFDSDKARTLIRKLSPNITDDQLNTYVNTLQLETNGNSITARFDNAMKTELKGIPTERQTQPATSVLTANQIELIEGGIHSQINPSDLDNSNLEAFGILNPEGGITSLADMDYDDLAEYKIGSGDGIKLDRLDSKNGNGMVELILEPKTGSNKPPLRLTADLSAMDFPDFRKTVASGALTQMQSATSQADRDAFYQIYSSFAMAEDKAEMRKAFSHNGIKGSQGEAETPFLMENEFLRIAFGGSIKPQKDERGYYNFYKPDGKPILIASVLNQDKAMQELYEKANAQYAKSALTSQASYTENNNTAE